MKTAILGLDQGTTSSRAIVWQDRRTAKFCDELRQAGHADMFRQKTGLVIDDVRSL